MNNIICFDFETGSVDPKTCQVLQLAAVAINPYKLEIIEGSEFNSLIKPEDKSKVEKGALEVNKIKLEDLEDAPSLESVWVRFVDYVNRFNPKPGNLWNAPNAAGKNILGFDLIIIDRLAEKFGNIDKKGKQTLFSPRNVIDLEQDIFRWFGWNDEMSNGKLDTIREYFSMNKDKAHDALDDSKTTAILICKFLKLYRTMFERVKFKG